MWSFSINQNVLALADGVWQPATIVEGPFKNSFYQDTYLVHLHASDVQIKRVYYLIRNADGSAPEITPQSMGAEIQF